MAIGEKLGELWGQVKSQFRTHPVRSSVVAGAVLGLGYLALSRGGAIVAASPADAAQSSDPLDLGLDTGLSGSDTGLPGGIDIPGLPGYPGSTPIGVTSPGPVTSGVSAVSGASPIITGVSSSSMLSPLAEPAPSSLNDIDAAGLVEQAAASLNNTSSSATAEQAAASLNNTSSSATAEQAADAFTSSSATAEKAAASLNNTSSSSSKKKSSSSSNKKTAQVSTYSDTSGVTKPGLQLGYGGDIHPAFHAEVDPNGDALDWTNQDY